MDTRTADCAVFGRAGLAVPGSLVIDNAGYNPLTDPGVKSAWFGQYASSDSLAKDIWGVDLGKWATSNFTVSAWVNVSTTGGGIVTKGYGNGGEQFCLDNQSATTGLRFFVRDSGGGNHNCNSTFLLDSAWHHVVGVCNETIGLVSLYIDGRQVATAAIGNGAAFHKGREFAAWLGLVPRQHSTGGKSWRENGRRGWR